jgi:histidyl-tRNA synthetase
MIQKMKGTYDILPSEVGKWQALERKIRSVSKIYHYQEIRTPIFEHSDLFHRSVGEHTDIVSKETYDFIDRGKRSNTLRPEGTAPVVRSYIEHKLYADRLPVQKLFYMGPMFRYERPQKGRFRQFVQFGAEAFGSHSPMLDAEVIAYAVSVLRALKIKDVTVQINSLGDAKSKELYKEALLAHLEPGIDTLCHDCQTRYKTNPLRILDCKVDQDKALLQEAPKPLDYLTVESQAHFDELISYLDAMDIHYTINKNLVRGLDYYTHTVFEVHLNGDLLGTQTAICGGGRYNNLVKSLDGPDVPAVGFAFGVDRLMTALDAIDFKGDSDAIHLYLMVLGEEQKASAMQLTQKLRVGGILTDLDFLDKSMKAQFKLADHMNARFVAIYGAKEQADGQINVKDQKTGEETRVSIKKLYTHIVSELTKPSQECETCEDGTCCG